MCPVEAPASDSQRCQPQPANLNADGTSRSAHGSQSTRQSLRSVEDQSRGGTLHCTFSVAIQKDLWSRLPSRDQMGCYFNKGLTFLPQKGGIIKHINIDSTKDVVAAFLAFLLFGSLSLAISCTTTIQTQNFGSLPLWTGG